METIRIMLVEDHSMIREGLKQLLELEDDIKVIAGFPDGRTAVEKYSEVKPDVVLMDINLPSLNGLEATELIRKIDSDAKIIMLTIHQDREYLLKALDLGAMGYILKHSDSKVLLKPYEAFTIIRPISSPIWPANWFANTNVSKALLPTDPRTSLQEENWRS